MAYSPQIERILQLLTVTPVNEAQVRAAISWYLLKKSGIADTTLLAQAVTKTQNTGKSETVDQIIRFVEVLEELSLHHAHKRNLDSDDLQHIVNVCKAESDTIGAYMANEILSLLVTINQHECPTLCSFHCRTSFLARGNLNQGEQLGSAQVFDTSTTVHETLGKEEVSLVPTISTEKPAFQADFALLAQKFIFLWEYRRCRVLDDGKTSRHIPYFKRNRGRITFQPRAPKR